VARALNGLTDDVITTGAAGGGDVIVGDDMWAKEGSAEGAAGGADGTDVGSGT